MTDMTRWPANRMERRRVADLLPYAQNAREHTQKQVEQIADSIRHFGLTFPPLVDERNELIAGHGRVLALKRLGVDECPVLVAVGWNEDEKRAYRIADNQHALNSTWDEVKLTTELLDLKGRGLDMKLTAFEPGAIVAFVARSEGERAGDPSAQWDGMPGFTQQDQSAFRSVLVHFKDEEAVKDFQRLIAQEFTAKARFIWHPEQVRADFETFRYKNDGQQEQSAVPDIHSKQG
jgi:ParB-like nuclease domain